MRLMTTLAARRDGTVCVRSSAGEAFVFQADAQGSLVCEIADSLLIQTLCEQAISVCLMQVRSLSASFG